MSRREPSQSADVDALVRGLRARGSLAVELILGPLPDDASPFSFVLSVRPRRPCAGDRDRRGRSPLLAVEAARAVARGERDLPAGLREVVRATFAEFGATTRTLAQVIAVSGVPLAHDDAQALLGSSSAEVFAATVAAGVRAGLLTSGERNIDFRHALLREAAYAEVPPPIRVALHERIARRLIAGGDDALAAAAARHLRLARRDDDAVPQLVRAAAHASRVAAATEAASFLAEAAAIRPSDACSRSPLPSCSSRAAAEPSPRRASSAPAASWSVRATGWLLRGRTFVAAPGTSVWSARRTKCALPFDGASRSSTPPESARGRSAIRRSRRWLGRRRLGAIPSARPLLDEVEAGGAPFEERTAIELGRARATALARQERFGESFAPGIAAAEAAERGGGRSSHTAAG